MQEELLILARHENHKMNVEDMNTDLKQIA
jgi:hypothetical protein